MCFKSLFYFGKDFLRLGQKFFRGYDLGKEFIKFSEFNIFSGNRTLVLEIL